MKKIIFIALLPLTLAILSFTNSCPRGAEIVKLPNGNYIMDEPVSMSLADEVALDRLLDIDPREEAAGFFWSCYTKDECKFQHGRIWGGGCCTSDPSRLASPESIAIAEDVRRQIDAIMVKYMK